MELLPHIIWTQYLNLNMDSSYEVVSMKDGVTSYSNEDILKMIAYLYGVQQSKE